MVPRPNRSLDFVLTCTFPARGERKFCPYCPLIVASCFRKNPSHMREALATVREPRLFVLDIFLQEKERATAAGPPCGVFLKPTYDQLRNPSLDCQPCTNVGDTGSVRDRQPGTLTPFCRPKPNPGLLSSPNSRIHDLWEFRARLQKRSTARRQV